MTSGDEIVLANLRADQKSLEEKLEKMRKPIAELEADLEHIKGVIAFKQRNANDKMMGEVEEAITEALATIPMSRLKNLSHSDAVVAIAKYNGGIVRTQDAKRLMIKAGIMSRTKNSTNMAHNAIKRTGLFERISPGEYRLIKNSSVNAIASGEFEGITRGTLFPAKPVQ